jgi:hypothetical protein
MNFEGCAFQHTSSLVIPCWIFEIRVLKGIYQIYREVVNEDTSGRR